MRSYTFSYTPSRISSDLLLITTKITKFADDIAPTPTSLFRFAEDIISHEHNIATTARPWTAAIIAGSSDIDASTDIIIPPGNNIIISSSDADVDLRTVNLRTSTNIDTISRSTTDIIASDTPIITIPRATGTGTPLSISPADPTGDAAASASPTDIITSGTTLLAIPRAMGNSAPSLSSMADPTGDIAAFADSTSSTRIDPISNITAGAYPSHTVPRTTARMDGLDSGDGLQAML